MSHPNRKSILLGELEQYPQPWVLTPTNGRKQPYRKGWQSEEPLSREALAQDIRKGRAQGVGIRSGRISGGILCIDFDGPSALPKYLELSGGVEPLLTVGWSSGKPGRWQLAFVVPAEKWDAVATKKIPTAWDSQGKATEFLEIRWDGCQSVLPGSVHPQTGSYHWLAGQSPSECKIALVPDFILDAAKPEPKLHQSVAVERVATAQNDNPWDIRNFAHFLDGYQPDGRRGWDTAKCPAHNGESDNSLHIEQSSGAFVCHAGCDSKDVYHAALQLAKSRGHQIPEGRSAHRFADLGNWMFNLKKRIAKTVERRKSWGVGRNGEVEFEKVAKKAAPAIQYEIGERLDVWSEVTKRGVKYVLDVGATGTGKSFDAGMATPELFGVRQLIYVSSEHRNPTVSTLQSWHDLEARHDGLVRDEFGKLRRAKSGEAYVVPPNCGRHDTISALRSKNIAGADTSGVVCQTCPSLEPCRAGATFNYLHDRAETLRQPRLRAHPASLPSPDEYDYSDVVLIWDEAAEAIKAHRSIEVRMADLENVIDRVWGDLGTTLPEAFVVALSSILYGLHLYLSGDWKQPDRYGWKDSQIKEQMLTKSGSVEDGFDVRAINVPALADALKPDLSFLNTTAGHGVDLADLPRQVRKSFSGSDTTTAQQVERELALNWLPDFLNVLLGNVVGGSLRIQHGVLTITLPDQRLVQIAQAAKANILLDATATNEDLARVLRVDPTEILTVQQTMPDTDNLEIVQVATMGRLGVGAERSDFCQQRVDAIISQIQQDTSGKAAVIDFKRFTTIGDGKRRWWTDSRGVNDLETCDALILVGVPCRNLASLEAEFAVMFGRSPQEGTEMVKYPIQVNGQPSADLQPYFEMQVSADKEFREFCRRRILADIHQAIGRLRAHRRPGQQLKVYFVGDYPLDVPVTLRKASDVTPDAATKTERIETSIRAAVQKLKSAGQKITQQAIAAITGYSQQHISRFRNLLISLLEDSNSKMSKTEEPPPDRDEAQWLGKEYLPKLASEPVPELLEGLLSTFEAYGQHVWQQIWDATPAETQVKILTALMFCLSANELLKLCVAAEVTA